MEKIGNSFLLVIEPLEFNIHDRKMNHETLGLVFGTQSSWLRDKCYDLATKYLEF